MTGRARNDMIVHGDISGYVGTLQGFAQGCTLLATLFNVFIDDMTKAIEAAN